MNLNELTPILKVKMQNWIKIIRQYQSSGLINKEWCVQNGDSEKSYCYHLAKIRKLALAEIPHKAQIKIIETTCVQEESLRLMAKFLASDEIGSHNCRRLNNCRTCCC